MSPLALVDQLTRQRHGGNLDEAAELAGLAPGDLVDFSSNVNPWGPPAWVAARADQWMRALTRYPDPEIVALRRALAARGQVEEEAIWVGNGMTELIRLTLQAIRPRQAVILGPTFAEYQQAVEAAGGRAVSWMASAEEVFRWDLHDPAFEQLVSQSQAIIVCSPNNPTGVALTGEEWDHLSDLAQWHGATLVVDEAFLEFADRESMRGQSLIRLRSLSKLYGLPGLRLGYLMAPPAMVQAIRRQQPTWSVSQIAQTIGVALLEDEAFLSESLRKLREAKTAFIEKLRRLSWLRAYPSSANFVLCELLSPVMRSSRLYLELAMRGIVIRNGDSFAGLEPGRWIRLAVRPVEEQARLMAALEAMVSEQSESNHVG